MASTVTEYNFDQVINRRGMNSLKWSVNENELAMWVADMDFKTAPEIIEAMNQRLHHGIFGYTIVPEAWYKAYQNWWERRHDFRFEKEYLIFATGVIPILSSTIRKLTTPGENILVQTPVYNIFFNCIKNNGRNVLESPLVYNHGEYYIDFKDLEEKLANPQTTMMLLCNPHNPVGKIWTHETLERIGELCKKHHVFVISDEIHCDLTAPGKQHIPFASVSETCSEISISCYAPTKAFNLAGIQTAAVMIPNEVLRHKVWRALNTDEVAEPNVFAMDAAIAAFEQGEPWLTELLKYIQQNKKSVVSFIENELPELSVVSLDSTYLLWIDCSKLTNYSNVLADYIRQNTGLYVSAGSEYGGNGAQFLRLNVACPASQVEDGLQRLKNGINEFKIWLNTCC